MYSFMVTCNKPHLKKKEQTLFDAARSKPQKNMAVTANPESILCDPGLYRVQSVRLRDGLTRLHCDDVGVHKTKTPKKEGFNKPFLIAPDAVETDRPRAGFPPNCWRLFVCHARSVLSFSSPHSFSVLAKVRVLLMFVAFHVYIFDAQTCVALTRGQGEYV